MDKDASNTPKKRKLEVLKVRIRKGIHKPISEENKEYYFLSPLENVQIGDWVLVETRSRDFTAAQVTEKYDSEDITARKIIFNEMPGSFAITKLPKNFDTRCRTIKKMKLKQEAFYIKQRKINAENKKKRNKKKKSRKSSKKKISVIQ